MNDERTVHQDQDQQQAAQKKSEFRDGPPASVPGYDLQYRLGKGAYGEVWLAIDGNTRRRVAIKFYNRSGGVDVSMLSREVEKLARLAADRYVVQLLEVGWNASPPYYVMDYIEGGSLEDLLGEQKQIDQQHAIEIFHDVLMGLKHLHNKGILHCDLKPGNVLLDNDHKPRLADFGQSRLDTEQAPALGTLFYMAPEQANLNAIPDVRWDIYSAGVLLYCMLSGSPPHRDQSALKSIQQIDGVEQRLEAYRKQVLEVDVDKKIRALGHVDSELKEILSKCLSKHPQKRFQSAQDVLLKLKQRDAKHAKRPLLILGILSPLLILLVMFSFFGYVYQQIMADTEKTIIQKAGASNHWAAQHAASTASHRIDDYFKAVTDLAENPDLTLCVQELTKSDIYKQNFLKFANPRNNENTKLDSVRDDLFDSPQASRLKKILNLSANGKRTPKAASWFITDKYGTQLASSLNFSDKRSVLGKNYSYRTYFSGLPKDIPFQDEKEFQKLVNHTPLKRTHIDSPHISAVFRSTATKQWKIAFTCPFYIEEEFGGIVAVTVDTGKFVEFNNQQKHYAMLVDSRPGDHFGTILEHPYFSKAKLGKKKIPDEVFLKRVPSENLTREFGIFHDPISKVDHQESQAERQQYAEKWISGVAKVTTEFGGPDGGAAKDTGLVVLVANSFEDNLADFRRVSSTLLRLSTIAVGGLIAVFFLTALFALRTIRQSGGRFLRYDSLTIDPESTQR